MSSSAARPDSAASASMVPLLEKRWPVVENGMPRFQRRERWTRPLARAGPRGPGGGESGAERGGPTEHPATRRLGSSARREMTKRASYRVFETQAQALRQLDLEA